MEEQNNKSKKHIGESEVVTRRMFIKGVATSFGALPVFAWPRWAQAFYYNLGFFKKGSASSLYVEDVFAPYLYTGNSATQTITNGIDLAGKGGLVWIKGKDSVRNHIFRDSARGLVNGLSSNLTDAQLGWPGMASFNTTGFNLGDDGTSGTNSQSGNLNQSGVKFASWTFRKAAKFFDIITYTGNGTAPRTLSHSLGIAPGMVVIKRTSGAASNWWVYHRSSPNQGVAYTGIGGNLYLDTADAADTGANPALSAVSASSITLSTNQNSVLNISGETYVVYLFAHDTSADGFIQCGSFTTDASGNATVTLGWEPQFLIVKTAVVGTGEDLNWQIFDSMRGMNVSGQLDAFLYANASSSEGSGSRIGVTSTGFSCALGNNSTQVYIAIRRGLMKTPTDATKVFTPIPHTSTGISINVSTSFPVDCLIIAGRSTVVGKFIFHDRLRGADKYLVTYSSGVEASASAASVTVQMDRSDGVSITDNNTSWGGSSGQTYVYLALRRAAGFFDQVCYTGDGTTSRQISHSLTTTPGMVILKRRSTADHWYVLHQSLNYAAQETLAVNLTNAKFTGSYFGATPQITDTYFTVGTSAGAVTADDGRCNASGETYVAYLFGNCPGVSKCGSFTGNGTSQTINCGFAAGARFILIKRTDAAGDWYAWDSARGIGAATDPHLSLNSSAVEVTTDDSIDPDNSGFIVNQVAATNINVSGATYIYMAIA